MHCVVDFRRVRSPALGHVRPPTPLAADGRRHRLDEIARLDAAADQILRHGREQHDLAAAFGGEKHGGGAGPRTKRVGGGAELIDRRGAEVRGDQVRIAEFLGGAEQVVDPAHDIGGPGLFRLLGELSGLLLQVGQVCAEPQLLDHRQYGLVHGDGDLGNALVQGGILHAGGLLELSGQSSRRILGIPGTLTGDTHYPADALGHGGFLDQPKPTGLARPPQVCSPAELYGNIYPLRVFRFGQKLFNRHADRHDAHPIGVLLAENRPQGVDLTGRGLIDDLRINFAIFLDLPVDAFLDAGQFVLADLRVVRQVEAGLVGIDERSLLLHMVAQHFAEGVVEDMGGGVVLDDLLPIRIDLDPDRVTHFEVARFDPAEMQDSITEPRCRLEAKGSGTFRDHPGIAHLSALFSVGAGLVQNQPDFVSGLDAARVMPSIVPHETDQVCLQRQRVIFRRIVCCGQGALYVERHLC